MDDLREGIGWTIGSIVAALGAFASWFYQSGLIATVVGIMIGAGITYFVQARTQKRVWKREYALRTSETIYGPLFEALDKALMYHRDGSEPQGFGFYEWDNIKSTYKQLMVDEIFSNRLDKLTEELIKFNKKLQEIRNFAHRLSIEEAKIAFPSDTEIFPMFIIKTQKNESQITVYESLISKERPDVAMLRNEKQNEKQEYFVALRPLPNGTPIMLEYRDMTKQHFDEFWEKCHKIMEDNSEVKYVRQKYPKLLEEMKGVRKELVKRIKEPWVI